MKDKLLEKVFVAVGILLVLMWLWTDLEEKGVLKY